jgi:hypothetical protein
VTNIPGPQLPLYVLGRQLQDLFPVAFLPEHHALAVAIMSYNGRLELGLLGDYDALPDIGVIAEGIEISLQELQQAARAKNERPPGRRTAAKDHGDGAPAPIIPSGRTRSQRGPAADMRSKRSRGAGSRPKRSGS